MLCFMACKSLHPPEPWSLCQKCRNVTGKNHASLQAGFTQSVSLSSLGAHKLVFFWTKPCWKIVQQLLCSVTAANGHSVRGIRPGGSPKQYSQNK